MAILKIIVKINEKKQEQKYKFTMNAKFFLIFL